MQQFDIAIKDNRQKSYLNFLLFSVLFNIMLFSWLLLSGEKKFILLSGLIFGICMMLIHLSKSWKKIPIAPHFLWSIFMVCWVFQNEWLPFFLNAFFIVTAEYLNRKIKIFVNEKEILIDTFPKKIFDWRDTENVLIKDGLMTIDLLNNKLYQFSVEGEVIDETHFNEFCLQQILHHKEINKQIDNFTT